MKTLHVTQPGPVRGSCVNSNGNWGVPLFDRNAGRLTLSAAGRDLLPRVSPTAFPTPSVWPLGRAGAGNWATRSDDHRRPPRRTLAEGDRTVHRHARPRGSPPHRRFACDGIRTACGTAWPARISSSPTAAQPTPWRSDRRRRPAGVGVSPHGAPIGPRGKPIDLADLEAETIISLPTTFSGAPGTRCGRTTTTHAPDRECRQSRQAAARRRNRRSPPQGRGGSRSSPTIRVFDLARMKVLAGVATR